LSGSFIGQPIHNQPIIVKEAFPIIHAMDRLNHFLATKHFIIHTDHKNLVYLLGRVKKEGNKILSQKVDRWLTELSGYSYKIDHISGLLNYWADLLSRWRSEPFMVRRTYCNDGPFADGTAEKQLTGLSDEAWRRFRAGRQTNAQSRPLDHGN